MDDGPGVAGVGHVVTETGEDLAEPQDVSVDVEADLGRQLSARCRPARLTDEDRRALTGAAGHGRTEAVRLMLDLGFPPGTRSEQDDGATALHLAAAAGSASTVRLLLDRGAGIEARDTTWNSTPLEWAIVGSGMRLGHDPHPDWPATVATFLDAGASTSEITLSPDDPKPPSPEVAALLRAHGIPGEASTTAGA